MQSALVTLVTVQLAPEFAEVKIGPGGAEDIKAIEPPITATNRVPSADAATEYQLVLGASLSVQVAPESSEV